MSLRYTRDEDGNLRSRPWYFRTRRFLHGMWCAECRDAYQARVYFDLNDWWIGYYRGSNWHFVCPLPTLVIRWSR